MSRNKTKRKPAWLWMNGVAVMTGAALLSKLIGTLQKIPLQNMAGDRVFGLYNAVYPFYQFIMVLATAGLPTAVSIIIARRIKEGRGEDGSERPALKAAFLLLGLTGVLSFIFMWTSANKVAAWLGDNSAAAAIRTLACALPLAPIVAVLRGYMQGKRLMGTSALSQVAEQLVRVAIMLAALGIGLAAGWSEAGLAAGVMSGSAVGAAAALLLLLLWMKREKPGRSSMAGDSRDTSVRGAGKLLKEMRELAAVALPAALAAIVVPALGVVDAFTVPRFLRADGYSEAAAMGMFGVYSRGQPLVQLVVMASGAAAAALVPGLVAAKLDRRLEEVGLRLTLLLRLAWVIGAAAAVGLVMLAEPINIMLYTDAQGTAVFALVGCTALAGCVSAVAAPALQALGAVRVPAALLLLAALLKGVLNAVLVPSLGIEGAAFSGVAALSAAAVLGAAALHHAAAGLRLPHAQAPPAAIAALRPAAGALAALAVMAAALWLIERGLGPALGSVLPPRAAAAVLALTGVVVGAGIFAVASLRGGVIGAREWRALPGGEVWAARLRRWRLIPPG